MFMSFTLLDSVLRRLDEQDLKIKQSKRNIQLALDILIDVIEWLRQRNCHALAAILEEESMR